MTTGADILPCTQYYYIVCMYGVRAYYILHSMVCVSGGCLRISNPLVSRFLTTFVSGETNKCLDQKSQSQDDNKRSIRLAGV